MAAAYLFLVRSMLVTRIVTFGLLLCTLTCCQSEQDRAEQRLHVHFPGIAVRGPLVSSLTVDDIRQIKATAQNNPRIGLPPFMIWTGPVDRVEVLTEDSRVVNRKFFAFRFNATKRNGTWQIDSGTIKKEDGLVAEDEGTPSFVPASEPY